MHVPAALACLAVLLAGCLGDDGTPTPSAPTTGSASLPPRQVFEKEGNNAQCTDVLTGEKTFSFSVESGYTHIEVTWHASGLGTVGYEIRGPNGTVAELADYNPADQPCNHAHSGDAQTHAAGPGSYDVLVRNQGILGWHLQINEIVGPVGAGHQHAGRV